MENLPNEIFFNIFIRLPFKTLLLCRHACKSWRSLLSSPSFASMQLHLNPLKTLIRSSLNTFHSLDFESGHTVAVPRYFPVLKDKSYYVIEVFGSCNGLVSLLVNRKKHPLEEGGRIVLWNPTTGDYNMLPDPHPRISTFEMLGFGYESSSDDYKIVRIKNDSDLGYNGVMDMYSLRTNSWEIISEELCMVHSRRNARGCFVNGCIYWLVYRSRVIKGDRKIIGFRLKDHKFVELALPDDFNKKNWFLLHLKVMGGRLCVYQQGWGNSVLPSVWILLGEENMEKEWIKWIDRDHYHMFTSNNTNFTRPICIRMKDQKILLIYHEYYGNRKKFIFLDPNLEETVVQDFRIQGISDSMEEIEYIETLVSPNSS